MSDLAHIAVPGIETGITQDSGSLPELVSLLIASGDLFYEWGLDSDTISWTGDIAGSLEIRNTDSLGSGDIF